MSVRIVPEIRQVVRPATLSPSANPVGHSAVLSPPLSPPPLPVSPPFPGGVVGVVAPGDAISLPEEHAAANKSAKTLTELRKDMTTPESKNATFGVTILTTLQAPYLDEMTVS